MEQDTYTISLEQLQDMAKKIMPLTGIENPTATTPAAFIGQTFLNTKTGKKFFCFDKDENGSYWQAEGEESTGIKDWGKVRYYSDFTVDYEVTNQNGGEITAFDKEKFSGFIKQHPPRGMGFGEEEYRYYVQWWDDYNAWVYESGAGLGMFIAEDELEQLMGICFEKDASAEYYSFSVEKSVSVNTESAVKEITLLTKEEYESLSFKGSLADTASLGKDGLVLNSMAIKEVYVGEEVGYTPDKFCSYCQNLDIVGQMAAPTDYEPGRFYKVHTFGNDFCSHCPSLSDRELDITYQTEDQPEVEGTIGDNFLFMCKNFNGKVTISLPVHIGNDFIAFCPKYNRSLYITPLSIGDGFLRGDTVFNQNITPWLESTVSSVQAEGGLRIGNDFLQTCRNYNNGGQPLKMDWVVRVGNNCLSNCSNLNVQISLVRVQSIGGDFCYECTAFAQPFTISPTVTSIGRGFFAQCDNFVGPLNVGKKTIDEIAVVADMKQSLATRNQAAKAYTQGVTMTGSARASWMAALPNGQVPGYALYRKLVDGGE